VTKAWILFDKKTKDARPVNGTVFYAIRQPLDDYRNSGSEWLDPEFLEVVEVAVGFDFEPFKPKEIPTYEAVDDLSDIDEEV
jgi:hypothetical protein